MSYAPNAVIGYSELTKKRQKSSSSGNLCWTWPLALINDTLDLSKIEARISTKRPAGMIFRTNYQTLEAESAQRKPCWRKISKGDLPRSLL
jgi:hypothetical protein